MTIDLKSSRVGRAVLVALLLGTAPAAYAQRLSDLPSGTRLRLRTERDERWRDVTFTGVRSDSLVFQEAAQPFVIHRDRVQALEWRDPDAKRWPHVLMGTLAAGAILGGAAAIVAQRDTHICRTTRISDECGIAFLIVPAAAVAGMLLGAVVGAVLPAEGWRAVDPPLP